MGVTRRKFLGASAAAVVAAGAMSKGKVFGANNRIGVCVVGFNGQGGSHIKDILGMKDEAEIVALCDVDAKVLERGVRAVEKEQGKAPKAYRDVRDALADENVHAVTTATPNHWHALITMWACKAGKDVYVEKPLSHNVWESRQLVAAAEKYGRIVMHGTQARSDSRMIRDMKLIHDGFIGKIVPSRGYVYKDGNRYAIGHGKPGSPPEELDWTLWQGPAVDREFLVTERGRGLYVHYNWHWFWEYGNGEIGNQGVHEMDVACWSHKRGLPVKIFSTGGRYGWDDCAETPNTQATSFTYDDGSMMTFEVRNLGSFQEADGGNCGNSAFGTDGYWVRGKGFFSYDERKRGEPLPLPGDVETPPSANKWQRFFTAVRSRKVEDLPMTPLEGHISCAHCQIGNIAYRLGRSLIFDPATERFVGDDEANTHIKRVYRSGFEPETLI